ncbi:iron complex outermembrane receptor protein [Sphingomonas sp. BE270]|jgi:iron complex outermembrane receptor protein|uniref:TonB-dependent receptor plug domain-containing protein n=1 Tax=Sphingomonas sp. BE270 TaxID=2817726 RepID=UPI0006905783|nr:TonB-dependent receptor [Sphingomonas sp. BE270]MDR7256183.1 iron complex outermembrane receptor protein [Sphingomonas sp. BE270]
MRAVSKGKDVIGTDFIARKARLLTGAASTALLLAAVPAFAQDQQPAAPSTAPVPEQAQPDTGSQGQDIVVTGSLIRNSAAATAAPINTLTAQDFANRGQNTIAEALQTIPANGAGTMTRAWNSFGFATGATAVSLRGLTTGNTLTLFDGLRSAIYPLGDDGQRSFVDLNTIPQSVVEKVDVLQDGASATYGADAVAGVVNVVVKKEIVGLHANASAGISQRGDGGETRADLTYGYGKLSEQGFNFYVNAEFQHDNPIYARDRGYPWNTNNYSAICKAGGTCLPNETINGIQGDGSFGGLGSTRVPVARPYLNGSPVAGSQFQLLNPAAGCRDLTAITLTPAQQAQAAAAGTPTGSLVCSQDNVKDYLLEIPEEQRFGATAHLTVNVGSKAQAYLMGNFYETQTNSSISPLSFAGQTAAGGTQFTLSPVLLPVYVCPRGTTVACTAANGTLNPNNPFAALGQQARVNYRYDQPRISLTDTKTYRFAGGIQGTFGEGWKYNADATYSEVDLKVTNKNYLNPQRLINVINDGSFNFVDPSLNTQATRDYIAPTNNNLSTSKLWQVQASVSKSFFTLPGGELTAAVGGAYRYESVNNPSANAPNEINPADRYYSINSVSTAGSRNVKSAFFQIDAPLFNMLTLSGAGRYDDYSSGQSNFSPKVTAIFKPIEQLRIRGTWSRGFRIPSFQEAYGQPTTGYITSTVSPTQAGGAAYIAAHGGDSYATLPYSYGLTSAGNPNLKPEKSTSITGGIVFEPTRRLTFTLDYYHIKIKGLIGAPDYSGVAAAYYANNGVVNVPGITVKPGVADPNFPNALPQLGFIQYSFINTTSETTSGLDMSGTARIPLGNGINLTSRVDATYLINLEQVQPNGTVQRFDGSLSPCNITSCSGAPKWRGSWQNTLDFNGKGTLSATAYYTSGYDMASVDYGGVPGDCANNGGVSVYTYSDGSPFKCRARRFIDVDMSASIKVGNRFTFYANVLNVFDVKPDFNPGQTYDTGFGYNVAWESQGFIGRFVRFGAKIDW